MYLHIHVHTYTQVAPSQSSVYPESSSTSSRDPTTQDWTLRSRTCASWTASRHLAPSSSWSSAPVERPSWPPPTPSRRQPGPLLGGLVRGGADLVQTLTMSVLQRCLQWPQLLELFHLEQTNCNRPFARTSQSSLPMLTLRDCCLSPTTSSLLSPPTTRLSSRNDGVQAPVPVMITDLLLDSERSFSCKNNLLILWCPCAKKGCKQV